MFRENVSNGVTKCTKIQNTKLCKTDCGLDDVTVLLTDVVRFVSCSL